MCVEKRSSPSTASGFGGRIPKDIEHRAARCAFA
jgi:hypothetical protein